MKKQFLTILIFIFTCISTDAAYINSGYRYNYYRTGYAHPKTRFAQPNKRFSKPQKRMAHVRPKYLYTPEYQKSITKPQSGMKRQYPTTQKVQSNIPSRFNKNFQPTIYKTISCGGITYYGTNSICKN